MKKYMIQHESYVKKRLSDHTDLNELLIEHRRQIRWMQHERLIHLLVLMLTTILLIIGVIWMFFSELVLVMGYSFILGILELFYLMHYFRLENTVQRWYVIDQTICRKMKSLAQVENK